jgi:hypothetical protein
MGLYITEFAPRVDKVASGNPLRVTIATECDPLASGGSGTVAFVPGGNGHGVTPASIDITMSKGVYSQSHTLDIVISGAAARVRICAKGPNNDGTFFVDII